MLCSNMQHKGKNPNTEWSKGSWSYTVSKIIIIMKICTKEGLNPTWKSAGKPKVHKLQLDRKQNVLNRITGKYLLSSFFFENPKDLISSKYNNEQSKFP